jgi:hypothetical protein
MVGMVEQHLTNPVIASLDVLSGVAIANFWLDIMAHPIGTFSTLMAGLWWSFCLYDGIMRRIENRHKREHNDDK